MDCVEICVRFMLLKLERIAGLGASFEEVADVPGNSPEIVRKYYAN